jgi:pimeloyl-ACP methyl ester carboxylesterase
LEALKVREGNWGKGNTVDGYAPSMAGDEEHRRIVARVERMSASPGAAQTLSLMNQAIVRHVLPTIGVPTLIVHRAGDPAVDVEDSRYLARHIRGANAEFQGHDHLPWVGDSNE